MKLRPINAVEKFLRASERLVVAAFFMICVSSDSLLKSSPVRVTSKKAISWKLIIDNVQAYSEKATHLKSYNARIIMTIVLPGLQDDWTNSFSVVQQPFH